MIPRILSPMLLVVLAAAVGGRPEPGWADDPVEPDQARPSWRSLFDGKSLKGWDILQEGEFADHGDVKVQDESLILAAGKAGTGIRWKDAFPRTSYEIEFKGKRVQGGDFFCGLTFPVNDGSLTLILGGWGGWMVGLSCLDGSYAVDNETGVVVKFKPDQWYSGRIRVTKSSVDVWLDDEHLIELDAATYKLTVSREMKPCLPLGLATWNTTGAIRELRYRQLPE